MPAITITDLSNAKLDVDHIAAVATSTAPTATDRLGGVKKTMAGASADVVAKVAEVEAAKNTAINTTIPAAIAAINATINASANGVLALSTVQAAASADSASEALGYLQAYRATSYGALASDPTTDPLGNAPTVGDEYFNTSANLIKRWNGVTWQASDIGTANLAASGGADLVGFKRSDVGAVAATLGQVLSESLSVFRWFTAAQIAAVKTATLVADLHLAVQAAIDAVALLGGGELFFPPGIYRLTDTIRMKERVWIRGAGFNSNNAAARITRLSFENSGAQKEACIKVDKPEDFATFTRIEKMLIACSAVGWDIIIKNRESHWFQLKDCYIAGYPAVAGLWMGAVIYAKITDNLFSIKGGAPEIDAKQENYPITYYGIDQGSIIANNMFYGDAAGIVFTGILTIENNVFEGQMKGEAKIIVEGPNASMFTINNNYLEVNDSTASNYIHNFIKLKVGCTGTITNNRLYGDNSVNGAKSIAINLNSQKFTGEISNNLFSRFRSAIGAGSSASSYSWNNNNLETTSMGVEFAGNSLIASVNIPASNASSLAISGDHDQVRLQRVDRSIPFATTTEASLLLRYGENIILSIAGTPQLNSIADAGLYVGARVLLYADLPFSLNHNAATPVHKLLMRVNGSGYTAATVVISGGGGSGAAATAQVSNGRVQSVTLTAPGTGYTSAPVVTITGDGTGATCFAILQANFQLTKGSTCTVPARKCMQFWVDSLRRLSEVGDYSVRL